MAVPFTLPAKVLLQDLCRKGLGWDDEIPSDYLSRWLAWLDDLRKLSEFSVNRCIKHPDFGRIVSSQIHHFCDASQSAYEAVSYLRLINFDDRIHCSFLVGKSRLAPLKLTSIPRLELAAATVSIHLNKMLKAELEIPVDTITFWTDSMTVIRYIKNESKRFHTYVSNGVTFIRDDSSPSQWRHIDTKSNPADDATRGASAEVFIRNDRWIKGPAFLFRPESEWAIPSEAITELSDDDPEVKRKPSSFSVKVCEAYTSFVFIVERFSSWLKLLKFIALCLRCQKRFVMRRRHGVLNISEQPARKPIILPELESAEREIIKFNQQIAFVEELKPLRKRFLSRSRVHLSSWIQSWF